MDPEKVPKIDISSDRLTAERTAIRANKDQNPKAAHSSKQQRSNSSPID